MNYIKVKHCFPPVVDKDSKILILGSFPSVKSREFDFYYMNKQNRFWKVLSTLLECDFECPIDERIVLLKKNNIALYDVIEECEIIGSSDSKIKNVIYADLEQIIKNTNIKAIILNGKKAYDLFLKRWNNLDLNIFLMPSTSPANAKSKLEDLLKEWSIIKELLK